MTNDEVNQAFWLFNAELMRRGATANQVGHQALTMGVGAAMGSGADSGEVLRAVRDLVDASVEYMQSDEYRRASKCLDELERLHNEPIDRTKLD